MSSLILAKIHLRAWMLLYYLRCHLRAGISCLLLDNSQTGLYESMQLGLLHFGQFDKIQSDTNSNQVLDVNCMAVFLCRPSSFILVFDHIATI